MRYANEALIHCKKRKWKAKTYLLEQSTQDVRVHVVIAFVLLPFIHFFSIFGNKIILQNGTFTLNENYFAV